MPSLTINDCIVLLIHAVADCLHGEYDLTSDGVPRIIFTNNSGMKIAVVFLASSQQWKAFYPFPAVEQTKKYFTNAGELANWLHTMGVDVC